MQIYLNFFLPQLVVSTCCPTGVECSTHAIGMLMFGPSKVMSPLPLRVAGIVEHNFNAGDGGGDVSPTCRAVVGAVGTR
jgi:hypothetical protein